MNDFQFRLHEYAEEVTKYDLKQLEKWCDELFADIGIDVEFGHHFWERVNDERNGKQITIDELKDMFTREKKRWGRPIAQMRSGTEALMKDASKSQINIPFIVKQDKSGDVEIKAKTVQRKAQFQHQGRSFAV